MRLVCPVRAIAAARADILQPLDDLCGTLTRTAQIETPQAGEAGVPHSPVVQHPAILLEQLGGREGFLGGNPLVTHETVHSNNGYVS